MCTIYSLNKLFKENANYIILKSYGSQKSQFTFFTRNSLIPQVNSDFALIKSFDLEYIRINT